MIFSHSNKFVFWVSSVVLSLMVICQAKGQGTFIPNGDDTYYILERLDIKYGRVIPLSHSNIRPYHRKTVAAIADTLLTSNIRDSRQFDFQLNWLLADNSEWTSLEPLMSKRPILRHFYREPAFLYSLNTKAFQLRLNPVFQYGAGYQAGEKDYKFLNTRGLELRAYVKKRLGFYTFFTDNQYRQADYVADRIYGRNMVPGRGLQAVPGEAYFKEFKEYRGVDFFSARGYLVFNVLDHVDVQFGHDKNFIGSGFRSLLLSDYGHAYFNLKLNTRVWRIDYQNIFTELTQQYDRTVGDRLLPKKYAAFHHLNFNVTHWMDIGLFEGVVFSRNNHFELQYLNPIIFYRTVEQALGSEDNSIVGMDVKVNFLQHFQFYGQLVLDEFKFSELKGRTGWWANKFGFQAGLKYIDFAGIPSLDAQLEFNTVRPYTYTHNNSYANFTHYNLPLAHPLGANFRELIGGLRYQPALFPRLLTQARLIWFVQGLDTASSNWGSDIFVSFAKPDNSANWEQEFGNKIGQGLTNRVFLADFLASWQFRHNLNFYANIIYRKQRDEEGLFDRNTFFFTAGVRLNLAHRFFHF